VSTLLVLLAAATCLPLVVLTRWTLDLKPGAGPQGGEAIFAGWLILALWLTFLSVLAAVRITAGAPPLARFVGTPAAVVFASGVLFWIVFALLNHSSLAEVPRPRAKAEIYAAATLVLAVIAANGWLFRRR
jgi:hypothetical protein